MNKLKAIGILIVMIIITGAVAYGQGAGQIDPKVKDLLDLTNQKVLKGKLDSLGKGEREEDLALLSDYYVATKQGEKADSIRRTIIAKFPLGESAFQDGMNEIFYETDGTLNEKKHAAFIKKFSKNPDLKGHRFFDYVYYYVGLSYLSTNLDKMYEWTDKIPGAEYRQQAFSYASQELINKGRAAEAEPFIRRAIKEWQQQNNDEKGVNINLSRILAEVLLAKGEYEEGYENIKLVYDNSKNKNTYLLDTYTNLLVGARKYEEAFPMMEESIKNGVASPLIMERFKEAYTAVKGNSSESDDYLKSLQADFSKKVRTELVKDMVNEKAYNFKLTDTDGNIVTLESLRGKVLVLDFWATWCGPCKASFPKMQKAVDLFKNDPEVEFLFIHTLERSSTATQDAENYIKANNYTFKLLMDIKDSSTKVNDAAKGYGITGIPAKFVIDKEGNIRFKALGNKPLSDQSFLTEMQSMIELAKGS